MEELSKDTMLILEMISARQGDDPELYYELMFKSICTHFNTSLTLEDPQVIVNGINALVKYFEAKEDYLKCHLLHKAGYAIFNRIE